MYAKCVDCLADGPYLPHSMVDLAIFQHKMMWALEIGEWILADQGYHDGYQFVIPRLSDLNGCVR
jgi:hypothetical protein